ncbi:hypothetical protein BDW42DRAFT_131649 [Aspergillus taichungensis]|uniref:MOSC domain-containing protein n=1 Tax=Aspergillus taichungensis TaxID=482145 RepID=A0A2J5I7H3_9EURO|nr:hypothetical protein BDW42DRAFT_131649 [Aspergillus taichungensis]
MLIRLLECLHGALETSAVVYGGMSLLFLLSLAITVVIQTGNTSTTLRKPRHMRKLGVSKSNMADQYDSEFGVPEGTTTNGPLSIKAIYIHPVKSCGPIELDRALLTKSGFLYDRFFALAAEVIETQDTSTGDSGSKWQFISQRTKPSMSRIKTELWLPHERSNTNDPLVQAGGCVVLTFPDPDTSSWIARLETIFHTGSISATPRISFIAPLQPTPAQIAQSQVKPKTFRIHARDVTGLDLGTIPSVSAVLPKLKRFLGIPKTQGLTLLKCTPESLTRTDRNLAPLEYIGSPATHGYTDQQPININSLSSVHATSALLPIENQPLNALRFRANIWMTGAPAYAEETWKRYRILPKETSMGPRADVAPTLSVVCRTSRCTIPNVDPDTGTFETDRPLPGKKKGKPQPSTTLVEHRTVETGNKKALGYMGMHCVPEDRDLVEAARQGAGLYVEVGDTIEVLERGEHLYGSTGNDY